MTTITLRSLCAVSVFGCILSGCAGGNTTSRPSDISKQITVTVSLMEDGDSVDDYALSNESRFADGAAQFGSAKISIRVDDAEWMTRIGKECVIEVGPVEPVDPADRSHALEQRAVMGYLRDFGPQQVALDPQQGAALIYCCATSEDDLLAAQFVEVLRNCIICSQMPAEQAQIDFQAVE